MTIPFRLAAAGALALAVTACNSSSKPDPYLQNLPDAAALTLDTSASAPAGAVAAGVQLVDPTAVPSTLQNDLAVVHERFAAVNAAVADVFAHLAAITSSGGKELAGNVKQWGPADRCVERDAGGACVASATFRLRVVLFTDHIAAFRLVVRPTSSTLETDFAPVLAGNLMREQTDHRGAGRLWVNLQNLKAAAGSGYLGQGWFAAGFHAGPVAKAVRYRMIDFSRDTGLHAPVTAAFAGWKNAAGVVRARVAGFADLYKIGPAQELGLWHAVWAPAYGGRAFTVVTDGFNPNVGAVTGDVPAGEYWFARACYPAGSTTPSYKEWFLCDKATDGPPASCVLNAPVVAGSHQGTVDPSVATSFAHWSETSCYAAALAIPLLDRDEVSPPTGAVPGVADDDGAEDGDHTGLAPEDCPTTVNASNPDPTPPGMGGMMGGGMM